MGSPWSHLGATMKTNLSGRHTPASSPTGTITLLVTPALKDPTVYSNSATSGAELEEYNHPIIIDGVPIANPSPEFSIQSLNK